MRAEFLDSMTEIQELVSTHGKMSGCLLSILILQLGCAFHTSETKTVKGGESPISATVQDSDIIPLIFRDKPEVVNAWRDFNKRDKYRMASFKDFQFSRATTAQMSGYDSLWQQKLDRPYIFGDIARLGQSTDLAMIIVDKDSENPQQRLGLIIFNALSDETYSTPVWVSRDSRLATSKLGWAGNWPTVFTYDEDGAIKKWYINWNPRSETYSLDEKQLSHER